MKRWLVAAAVIVACSGIPPAPDGGTAGGGSAGGGAAGGGTAGGGTAGGGLGGGTPDAGCVPLPGCPCDGSGGGAIAFSDRLVVASRSAPDGGGPSVRVFNWASSIAADQPGTPQPLLAGVPVALVSGGGPLSAHAFLAVLEGPVPAQQWVGNLTPGCDRPSNLPAVTSGAGRAEYVSGQLWFLRTPGEVVHLTGGVFSRPGRPLLDFTYEPSSDRLYAAGQNGILVWSDAGTRDGGVADFQLSADPASRVQTAGGRLYASARTGTLGVWESVAGATAPRAFDFALDAGASASIQHHVVASGQLIVTLSDRVLIYRNIAATAGDRAPDVVIAHPTLAGARETTLTDAGVLFVLTAGGVSLFADALGAPAFRARLTLPDPTTMLYLP